MGFFQATPGPVRQEASPADVEIPDAFKDSISSLAFSPTANILAVGGWDQQVRLYEIGQEITGRAAYVHNGPVLDVCWNTDGTKVVSAGGDNTARMMDVQSGIASQVAMHQDTVMSVRWTQQHGGLLVTGSWDRTLKYWDLRTPSPVSIVQLQERCYSMDLSGQLLVVATAERKIQTFDLRNPGTQYGPTIDSPLKFQTRSIACFPDQTGYAIGSVEGRVAVQYIDEIRAKTDNFSFKCHRVSEPNAAQASSNKTQLCSVNTISFHPLYGTFASGGSDGSISFWDKANKTRLTTLKIPLTRNLAASKATPVMATAFNYLNGSTIFAYALSYDWTYGVRENISECPPRVLLHLCKENEIKEKGKQ